MMLAPGRINGDGRGTTGTMRQTGLCRGWAGAGQ
jgi:hypothetical protein